MANGSLKSVRQALTQYFLIASVVPIVVSGIFVVLHTSKYASRAKSMNHGLEVRLIADSISKSLGAPQTIIEYLFAVTSTGAGLDAVDLDQTVGSNETFEAIIFADRTGTVIDVGFAPELRHLRDTYIGLDLRNTSFLLNGHADRRPVWSDTFPSFITGNTVTTISISDETYVMIGIVRADFIERQITASGNLADVEVFITDRNGIVLSSTSTEQSFNSLNLSNIDLVRATITGASSVNQDIVHLFGNRYVATGIRIAETGWAVVLMQHWVAYHEQEQNILQVLTLIFAGALVFALALTAIASRNILTPLKQLINKAAAVSRGTDEGSMSIEPVYEDIKELDAAFDSMLGKIKERESNLRTLNLQLEDRVHEETRKRLSQEQVMHEQQKLADMGRMVNAIAHQWRQPLNALSMHLQLMQASFQEHPPEDESIGHAPDKALELVSHMDGTVSDFLNFFRPRPASAPFSVVNAIRKTANLILPQLTSQGITLTIHHGTGDEASFVPVAGGSREQSNEMATITGNESTLTQVIMNLIQNARDQMVDSGVAERRLSFRVEESVDTVTIVVSDTGGGIDIDVMNRLFEPYFTTKSPDKGTGIGLYMTRMIIEQQFGGTIDAENDEHGAAFTIRLPKTFTPNA